jgi:eukaryotic-like serine/threonine-protein kinase
MGSPAWQHIERLFHGALEQPGPERRRWLAEQAGDDPALIEQVMRLLECSDEPETRLQSIIGQAAADLGAERIKRDRRLGPYRILDRLGNGGMGEVYLAERDDQEYRQKVAIKVIRGFPGDEALDRFRRERQILAELQHPHIARLLDGGTTPEGQPYLVMDYVDGPTLGHWCSQNQASLETRLRLLIRICDAIHHAHQHLVIHRDIKPGNVLVSADGLPMVVDFGIAKMVDQGDTEATRFMPGYTPGFSSPEQLDGKVVTTASDTYSLGRLILATLAPQSEAASGQPESLFRRPAWTRQLAPDLVAIIETATREDPSERYASAASLRDDLKRFLDGRPVQALASTLRYRAWKFLQRQRAAVLAVGIGLLVTGVLTGQWFEDKHRASVAESRALQESQHAEQVLGLLLDTIGSASPGRAQGARVTVKQVVDESAAALDGQLELSEPVRQRMRLALGEVYLRLEEFEPAIELLTTAADGPSVAVRARALSLLGFSYLMDGRIEPAGPVLDQALSMARSEIELPEATVHEIRNHHALWLLDLGQLAEAEAVFAELARLHLDQGRKELAARMLHNQALAASRAGRWDQSVELLGQSLDLKKRTTGPIHPAYANSLQVLSQSLARLGRHQQARAALMQSFELRQQLFGRDHPGLHQDFNEIGSLTHDEGDFLKAIEHYEQAIRLHGESGDSAIAAVSYINNLAFAHEDRGDLASAEPLFRQSLALRRSERGPDHPSVALAEHNLARLLILNGQLDEGRALVDSAIAKRSRLFGPDHQATWYSRALLGLHAYQAGQLEQARTELQTVLDALGDLLPRGNGWFMAVERMLAVVEVELGDLAQAQARLEELAERYETQYGAAHPHAAVLKLHLAGLAMQVGHREQADRLLAAAAGPLRQQMLVGSLANRHLDCLERGELAISCWKRKLSAVSQIGPY